jgi:integration host factor subunit beta
MKKADLVTSIAHKHQLPRGKTQDVIEDLLEELAAALVRGDKIDLRGFGTFSIRSAKARLGRNPRTGVTIEIPARRVPDFRPGTELLSRCNRAARITDADDAKAVPKPSRAEPPTR